MFVTSLAGKAITRAGCVVSLAAIMLAGCQSPKGEDDKKAFIAHHSSWRDYGGGPDQSKYIVQDQITKANVAQLKIAWTYPTADDNVYQFNPLVVDSVMYVLAKDNSLVAIHATNGKELWIHTNLQGIAPRGINYWESKDRKDRRLLFQMNNYLQAIDARTGLSILSFGKNGLVDLKEGLGRDPKTLTRAQSGTPGKVFENLLILGSATGENYVSSPGHLRAYDVVTGKMAWIFHTIPHPGEPGYETWPKDAYKYIGGVNTWGEISVDPERGIAYFPLGSPTYDYYGGDRIGTNLYGNCILALDARTGKRLWHQQLVHHDLWDYDVSAAPQLITVTHGGKKKDAVAVAVKNGFMFAFDRVSGESLWPIEERPVPPSDIPGEQAWPTQPFPTVLPPFGRQQMTSKDLSTFFLTPEERVMWTKRIDSMRTGLYTPVSMTHETLSLPGAVGGASWGSTAADPVKGIVYVRTIDWPSVYGRVEKREAADSAKANQEAPMAGGLNTYMGNCQVCHGVDRRGGIGPQLLDLKARYNFKKFQQLVSAGKGEMPAFPQLDETALKSVYDFLATGSAMNRENRLVNNKPADVKPAVITGPVVASGGAPGGQQVRKMGAMAFGAARLGLKEFGLPYPKDAEAPTARYFIPPGWGLGFPYLISPPWSSIVAYDMNKGTILWKTAIGQDQKATEEGGKQTGVLRSQRNGMIVTSTGILFCTARDGKIYAFDSETGKELWAGQLPSGTQGLPTMYSLGGKQYLAVSATTPVKFGREEGGRVEGEKPPPGSYVVFALP